ncbi:fungal-specific transcription factor domain-containing protein [Mycena albidolilacea]|uniref:Fungal-specific transcription factor domain-containing protein n=1 Tax=Mycena albidolilacea TaxID=1033008 RepID=A0AAD7AC82_9AGAR|nr:fungal-specific transcription factor domain-containing protein [Mycena albidolilacea]
MSTQSSNNAPQEKVKPLPGGSSRKTSCEECHRLKMKCDKKVPCGLCVRRGCESICPTGTLHSSGRGKRSVLSDVPHLTAKITEMGERIRQLEQAVASTRENTSHPLLSTATRPPSESTPAQTDEVLGTFSVNDVGDAVYFGPTAGSAALFSIEDAPDNAHRFSFTAITESFPFSSGKTSWDADQALEHLLAHLPLEIRALGLCETYFRNGCWTAMPVMQCEAVEVLTLIYHGSRSLATPQQMAVLYLIFALGALVDLDLPPYNYEADHYFDLACAAMSIKPLFEQPTAVTVQALMLLSCYYTHGGRRFSMESGWNTVSLASSISQRLGLHRESFGLNLPPKSSNRCRALFWETYTLETIYGLSVGRPTGTFLSDISCPYPPDEADEEQPFVKIFPGYRHARWQYIKEIAAPLMEDFLTTKKPRYEGVLAMDQKIREYMHSYPFESFPTLNDEPPFAFLQRHLFPLFLKITLMYLHKGSFVEAMRDDSTDPLSSSYSASFLAAYRNASEIIKANIQNFTTHPMLFTRWWLIWKSLFNAAIIVGTVATRFPDSKIAPDAVVEFFTAVDLIEKGAVSSGRARNGLAILRRLRDKVIGAYTLCSADNLAPPPFFDPKTEEELKIFAGYTRIIAKKALQRWPPQTACDDPSLPSFSQHPDGWEVEKFQQGFDPTIIQSFDTTTPFGNVMLLPEPQALPSVEDAGFCSTYQFNLDPSESQQSDFHRVQIAYERQWADFLRTVQE